MSDLISRDAALKTCCVHDCEYRGCCGGPIADALKALPPAAPSAVDRSAEGATGSPVDAAARALAEAVDSWMESVPCSTAFHRSEGGGDCGECVGRASMLEALATYRAAVAAEKESR